MTEPAVPCADWQRQPYRRLLALATAMATGRTLTDLLQDLAGHLQGFLDFQSPGIMLYDGARPVAMAPPGDQRTHETANPSRCPAGGVNGRGAGVVLPSCLHGKSV
jgi:hypothetical protein